MFGGEAHVGVGVHDLDRWQQGSQAGCEALPVHAMALASTSKRLYPAPQHIAAKRSHPREIARNGVILEIPLHHLLQPLHGSRHTRVHPLTQLRPNILELGCHAFGDRFPADRESGRLVVRPTDMGVSRPGESRLEPLAEPSVRLSPHSAPIKRTRRPYRFSRYGTVCFVACIEILLFPVVSLMPPPDPTPLLQPYYRAFFAHTSRSAPVLRIGTLASRFWPLALLPSHRSDWFLQFRAIACIRVTPSLRRPPPAQSSGTSRVYPR